MPGFWPLRAWLSTPLSPEASPGEASRRSAPTVLPKLQPALELACFQADQPQGFPCCWTWPVTTTLGLSALRD